MNKQLIIFDMDGTLYKFEGGSFGNSGLKKRVLENAIKYISDKQGVSLDKGKQLLEDILKKYDEEISIAVEKEFNGDRHEYFNTVWDIDAKEFIEENSKLKELLKKLKEKYILVVVSDAPAIWTENVLKELGVYELFEGNIFDGTGDERKVNGNGFDRVLKKFGLKGESIISIGDQVKTDIIPGNMLGMTTVFIGDDVCEEASYSIKNIFEIESILTSDFEIVLKEYFEKNNIEVGNIKKLDGSSDATAYRCDDKIYKVGPDKTILDEVKTFERFKSKMKSYSSVFPNMEVVQASNDISILWIENCGGRNFDDIYLGTTNDLELLTTLNRKVLAKIGVVFNETKFEDSGSLFFEELMQGLKLNLKKAELWLEYEGVVQSIEKRKAELLKNFVASFAHKDLSVGNVLVSDDNKQVRFIDPRLAVPYLEESQASGNVAIDLMGYYVSFLRKEMEARKNNEGLDFSEINKDIEKEIKEYKERGVFSEQMGRLCMAVWYSVYAACKCDYCTAPERVWLYDEMVVRLRKSLDEL
jgi:FMN phosphatase YigB (HAD superfamily)